MNRKPIEEAKKKLIEICENNFKDKTFHNYINKHLAGDFAVEIEAYTTELEKKLEIAVEALEEMRSSLYFERNTIISVEKVVNALKQINEEDPEK